MGSILIQGIQSDPINFYETYTGDFVTLNCGTGWRAKTWEATGAGGKWSISQRAVRRGKERALEDGVGRTLERPAATGPKEGTNLPCLPKKRVKTSGKG